MDRKRGRAQDYEFDSEVASVFDDMVARSVPMPADFRRMCAEMMYDSSLWIEPTSIAWARNRGYISDLGSDLN